jgi:hypothetical protein
MALSSLQITFRRLVARQAAKWEPLFRGGGAFLGCRASCLRDAAIARRAALR